ncbi:Mycolic acid cyclopropane synthetase-domain-containing protein [Syncephalis fuscata]|nr:Mycolic acid cyclopropane synthetase-domain-containing protein [Syncephalis fuscata]
MQVSTLGDAYTYAMAAAWSKAVNGARSSIISMISRATVGHLHIVDVDGTTYDIGNKAARESKSGDDPVVKLYVLNDRFWLRLALFSDVGFGESYMYEEIDIDKPVDLVKFFLRNREQIGEGETWFSQAVEYLTRFLSSRFINNIANSLRNIQEHYDLGNRLFCSFLDASLTYSSAEWDWKRWEASKRGDATEESLESAQIRKIRKLIDMCCLKPGDRLLEIGSGWGALSIEAVLRTGCTVTTLTLSEEQKQMAEARIKKAGLEDSITVLLCDYRMLEPTDRPFDAIVAVEMLEAVGHEYFPAFFGQCHQLLHPQHGVLVAQVITMPESRYDNYRRGVDFINKYIFPGGHCPSVHALMNAATSASSGNLVLDYAENRPRDYARTLKQWRLRFDAAASTLCKDVESSKTASSDVLKNDDALPEWLSKVCGEPVTSKPSERYDKVFERRWRWYLSYCEGGFSERAIALMQLRFTRPANDRQTAGYE